VPTHPPSSPHPPAPAQHRGSHSSILPPKPPPAASRTSPSRSTPRRLPSHHHHLLLFSPCARGRSRRALTVILRHLHCTFTLIRNPRSPLQSFRPSWVLQHDRDTAFLRLSHGFPSRQSNAKPVPYLCAGLDFRRPARSTLHRRHSKRPVVVQTAVSARLTPRLGRGIELLEFSRARILVSVHCTTHCCGGWVRG